MAPRTVHARKSGTGTWCGVLATVVASDPKEVTCRRCLALLNPRPATGHLLASRRGRTTAVCGAASTLAKPLYFTTEAKATCPACLAWAASTCRSCHRTSDERPDPDPLVEGLCGACREADAEVAADQVASRRHGQVYVVITMDGRTVSDVEVLDAMPRWDWEVLNQVVRVGNVNGGDSVTVEMPAENRGR